MSEQATPTKQPFHCRGFAAFMRGGFAPGDEEMVARKFEAADAEIERLRRFVQFVADHSNDPGVVREAKLHGAE